MNAYWTSVGAVVAWLWFAAYLPAQEPARDAGAVSSREPVTWVPARMSLFPSYIEVLRSRLADRGIYLGGGYIGEGMANLAGGLKAGAVYQGLAKVSLDLDLERLTVWWRGGRARASGIYPHGEGPSSELVGDLQGVSNISAYDSAALYELWFEQNFLDDRLSVRLGQLVADSEFAGTGYGNVLINSSFGWPAFISGNTPNTGPAYPRGSPGTRLRVESSNAWYVQTGVYVGDTGRPDQNTHGVRWELSGRNGAFAITEAGLRLNQDKDAQGLPGTYKMGAWMNTADFPDPINPARARSLLYGPYVAARQLVWRKAGATEALDQGIGLFFRSGISPEDYSQFLFAFDAGIHGLGLIPGRPEDQSAIGVAFVRPSEEVRQAARDEGARFLPDYELAAEITYHMKLKPWWTLQPDLQWVRHPGGSAAHGDAIVLGLRTRISF
ncbi:MAG: carbohydrate porin [Candidatus Omnitrophica bacterium]|nr:carbohydrate porin [Candidatus Omnitrophota bacterium]